MNTIDIARKLVALGQQEEALKAYTLAIHQNNGQDPMADMEAALYILEHDGDYKISYTCFRNLYNRGHFREDILSILDQAFFTPNEKVQRNRYRRNCDLLAKYPYCFRKDFPAFEDLPIRFYPYDDNGFLPFRRSKQQFGEYINFKKPVISRNFFKDLENPILAENVYSQYELEYLNDNVRRSEYVGRENHIYLHYTSWADFCAHLQCLDLRPLVKEWKVVFLMDGELSQYPIDFKERFGVDYSQHTPKPVGIREIHRLIWHTQLSSHNGGDFFNEVFDGHPNLLSMPSVMLDETEKLLRESMDAIEHSATRQDMRDRFHQWTSRRISEELMNLPGCTEKDLLVAAFLENAAQRNIPVDPASRIAPALFFQPHFPILRYDIKANEETRQAILYSEEYEQIRQSPIFRQFKYIKTFTPIRRITTSYGATVKFMVKQLDKNGEAGDSKTIRIAGDDLLYRILNRSFMADPQDRLFQDAVLVRFEDGKLNPRATFTALAAFLDLPYTESLTYCSLNGERDPESFTGNARGFDPAPVYNPYDEYVNDAERCYLEGLMADVYKHLGYDFLCYDGRPLDEAELNKLMDRFDALNHYLHDGWRKAFAAGPDERTATGVANRGGINEDVVLAKQDLDPDKAADEYMVLVRKQRMKAATELLKGLRLVSLRGQPLRFIPKLELDPALLEQPLYH